MKWFILSFVFGVFSISADAQHNTDGIWDENSREAWLDSVTTNFNKKQLTNNIKIINLKQRQIEEITMPSCKVKGEGLLYLSDNEWIYFLSNSNHDNPTIGDITIGIDQKGNAWFNGGHVCGGIINYVSKGISELKLSKEFFKYFESDTDEEKWQRR